MIYDNVTHSTSFSVWKELHVIFEFNASIHRDEDEGRVFSNPLFKVTKAEVIFIARHWAEFEVVAHSDHVTVTGDVKETKVCILFP